MFISNTFLLDFDRDRLSASDMIQVRKVIEHVYEKVMGQGSDAGSQSANSNSQEKSEQEKEEDLSSIAEEKVELLCNDQVHTLTFTFSFWSLKAQRKCSVITRWCHTTFIFCSPSLNFTIMDVLSIA